MSKDANSFLLDSNIFENPKVLELRAVGGMEYAGLLVGILCRLRDAENYKLNLKLLNGLAFSFGITKIELEAFLDLCFEINLLKKDDSFFWSSGLDEKLEVFDEKRKKRSEAGKRGAISRWQKEEDLDESNNLIIANDSIAIVENNETLTDGCEEHSNAIANDSLYKFNSTKNKLKYNLKDLKKLLAETFFTKEAYRETLRDIEALEIDAFSQEDIEIFKLDAKIQLEKYPLIFLSKNQIDKMHAHMCEIGLTQKRDFEEALSKFQAWALEKKNSKIATERRKYNDKVDHLACIKNWAIPEVLKARKDELSFETAKNYNEKSKEARK